MHPVLIAFGPLKIPTYGFLMAIGFLIAFHLAIRKAENRKIDIDKLTNLLFIILFFSIIGSRLVYVGLRWETFARAPLDIFKLWKGGMVFYGGLIFALVSSLLYCKKASLPIGEIADIMAPSLALGHIFGRLGCFAYGCCYGLKTTFCTGVHFPHDLAGVHRHPTQLYEALAELVIFIILSHLYKNWCVPVTNKGKGRVEIDCKHEVDGKYEVDSQHEGNAYENRGYRNGSLLLAYVVLYSTFRFFNEYLRGDNRGGQWMLGLSVSQNGALFLILLGGIMLLWFRITDKKAK